MPGKKLPRYIWMLSPCSLQLPDQDIIVGDNHGNLTRHKQDGSKKIIPQRSSSAVCALALLPQCKQYVSAHTDGYIQFRNLEDRFESEFQIGYAADFLAELPNGLLLIKSKETFDIYNIQNRKHILKQCVAEKFLAHIPNTNECIFQDLNGFLSIMQITDKGFIRKKSITLPQHDNTEIQALRMFSQTTGIMFNAGKIGLCKLNENSFTRSHRLFSKSGLPTHSDVAQVAATKFQRSKL